jgi:hypothetical protein
VPASLPSAKNEEGQEKDGDDPGANLDLQFKLRATTVERTFWSRLHCRHIGSPSKHVFGHRHHLSFLTG